MIQDLELDELFKQARAALRQEKAADAARIAARKPPKKPAEEEVPDTQGIYANPANWVRGKGVALIHEETGTLLGNFTEYRHKTVADARRLVREAEAAMTYSVEYVLGDWWLASEVKVAPKRAWKTEMPAEVELNLIKLGVRAPLVRVVACFGEGTLDSVRIENNMTFYRPGEFIVLPAGTDVLPCMAQASIRALLDQLGQP